MIDKYRRKIIKLNKETLGLNTCNQRKYKSKTKPRARESASAIARKKERERWQKN